MMHTFTTGGMCLRWFRDVFCQDEISMQELTDIDAYDLLNKEVDRTPAGADGLIMLPHLQGLYYLPSLARRVHKYHKQANPFVHAQPIRQPNRQLQGVLSH